LALASTAWAGTPRRNLGSPEASRVFGRTPGLLSANRRPIDSTSIENAITARFREALVMFSG
jgi:hypothetical protein